MASRGPDSRWSMTRHGDAMSWKRLVPTQDTFAGMDFSRWTDKAQPAKVTRLTKLPDKAPAIAPVRRKAPPQASASARVAPDPRGAEQMRRSIEVRRLMLAGMPRAEAIRQVYGDEC